MTGAGGMKPRPGGRVGCEPGASEPGSRQDKAAERDSWVSREIRDKGCYDTYEDRVYEEIFQATVLKAALPAGSHILDVGCASGAFSGRLRELGFRVTGCDISREGVESARRLSQGDSRFVVCDIESACFRTGSFDACFCSDLLHHFPDLHRLVPELGRITKPGGTIFTLDPNRLNLHNFLCQEKASPVRYDKLTVNERAMGPKELERAFGAAGLATEIGYLSCTLRRKGAGIWNNRFLYRILGFILVSVRGFWKRLLAFFLFNLAHAVTPLLSGKRRANIIVCIARKVPPAT